MKRIMSPLVWVFASILVVFISLPFESYSQTPTGSNGGSGPTSNDGGSISIPDSGGGTPVGPTGSPLGRFFYLGSFPKLFDDECSGENWQFYHQHEALPLIKKVLNYFGCPGSNFSWDDLVNGISVDKDQPGYCVSEVQGKAAQCAVNPPNSRDVNIKSTNLVTLTKDCLAMNCNFAWIPVTGEVYIGRVNLFQVQK